MTALSDRLTVVLLTYNCAHRIRPILHEIVSLGLPVVAVDNASQDTTREVLAEFPAIEVVALDENIGAAGRNVGLARARTPYVAFCDDDSWYERDGLQTAVDALDCEPRLALVNARIIVEPDGRLDPISATMANSPLPGDRGTAGIPILGFMAGFVVVRVAAFKAVGGYDPRYFMGGEEQTVAIPLARAGWQLRYRTDVVAHHRPSIANAPALRAHGLRNALWTCWLHRRLNSAVRVSLALLGAAPKDRDWVRGLAMALRGVAWLAKARDPVSRELDRQLGLLDQQRFGKWAQPATAR